MADISAAVTSFRRNVIKVLRIGTKSPLVLHIIDAVAQGVLQVKHEALGHPLLDRYLEAVVGTESGVALEQNVSILRLWPRARVGSK